MKMQIYTNFNFMWSKKMFSFGLGLSWLFLSVQLAQGRLERVDLLVEGFKAETNRCVLQEECIQVELCLHDLLVLLQHDEILVQMLRNLVLEVHRDGRLGLKATLTEESTPISKTRWTCLQSWREWNATSVAPLRQA